MIKTYNEALEKLNNLRHRLFIYATDENLPVLENCVSELDAIAKFFIYEKRNKPTLEEIIKKWEELGYICVFSNNNYLLDIFDNENYSVIKIDIKNKKCIKVDSVIYSCFEAITFQEHQLLTETMKALGWFDE